MKLSAFTLFLCCALTAVAQQTVCIGVYDRSDRQPLAGAAVCLTGVADSIIHHAIIADEQGIAVVPADSLNHRRIAIAFPGYVSDTIAGDAVPDSVFLSQKANELNELVVKRQRLTRSAGKFVFDPGELRNEVPNVYEALRYTPLVNLDGNSLRILGKGRTEIYINGRSPGMGKDAVVAYLRSLPAGQIKSIEIITAPGSSQRADGADGIINVIVSNPYEGVIGMASADVRYYSHTVSPGANLWLGYNKGKFSGSVIAVYNRVEQKSKTLADYTYSEPDEKHVHNTDTEHSTTNILNFGATAKYTINRDSRAGVSFNGTAHNSRERIRSLSSVISGGAEPILSEMGMDNSTPWSRPIISGLAYYTLYTDSLDSNLDITATFNSSTKTQHTGYTTSGGTSATHSRSDATGYSAKAKYKWNMTKQQQLLFGYEFYRNSIDNTFDYGSQTNIFDYRESVHAAFAQWNAKWSDALSVNIGLRMEHSTISGASPENAAESFTNRYTDIFPTLSLSWDFTAGHNLSVDIGRSMYRPFYSSLNPFVVWTSETTCRRGNPLQKPEYAWNTSVYYSLPRGFILAILFSRTTDTIYDYTFDDHGVTVSSSANIGNDFTFSPYITFNRTFGRFRLRAETGASFNKFAGGVNGTDLSYSHWDWRANASCRWTASRTHGIYLSVSGAVYSPIKRPGGTYKWKNILSFSAGKSWNCGLDCSFNVYNILGWANNPYYTSADYSYSSRPVYGQQMCSLSLSYTFGKQTVRADNGRRDTTFSNRFRD